MAGLIDLDEVALGTGGFKIQGEAAYDRAGWSVSSAGDVNGDGIDDLIVGAYRVGGNAGAAYVVFSNGTGFTSPVSLAAIALGSGGFKIQGEAAYDLAGWSVSSAGDVNGDGIDDLIVGAPDNGALAGAAYVVFGRDVAADGGFTSPVSLTTIAGGTGGFKIEGEDSENAGISVSSAGDVNGDGFDDLIVGAVGAGAAYVVFGKDVAADGGFTSPVSLTAIAGGTGGFKILGEGGGDDAGQSVSSAGDVNGDGIDDLIVGAPFSGGTGAAYVVFGRDVAADGGFTSPVSLAAIAGGTGGFKIEGEVGGDRAGWSVSSAGDVNGDGIDDVIVGANRNGGFAGAAYVVFGRDVAADGGFSSPVSLAAIASGSGGFKIEGEADGDQAGVSVSAAGDVNGDGIDDLIVGANSNDSGNNAGAAYVVFGRNANSEGGFTNPVSLADVAAGAGGFKIEGEADGFAGFSVSSAGDVNGDGFADLLVGAPGYGSNTGAAYVVYGFATGPTAEDDSFAIGENGPPVVGNVITNTNPNGADSDPDFDPLTLVAVKGVEGNVGQAVAGSNGGLFIIAADGSLTFNPNGQFASLTAGQTATTTITYTISDGGLTDNSVDTATVTVTVTGVDQPALFTTGNDTRDLNAFNLNLYPNAQATKALSGNDVVQLSQTQKLGVVFEGGAGNDTVTGSSSTDRIHGNGGKDRLLGEAGNDSLWGDAGDDLLVGGNGNDVLYAGDGFDYLTGGNGNDSFVFEDFGATAAPEEDAIIDFVFGAVSGNKDVIDLRAFDLVDWTGSDSQITVAGSGSARTIYVDLNDDNNAGNNTTQAEVVIYVNAGIGGLVRNFVISDTNSLADILV